MFDWTCKRVAFVASSPGQLVGDLPYQSVYEIYVSGNVLSFSKFCMNLGKMNIYLPLSSHIHL